MSLQTRVALISQEGPELQDLRMQLRNPLRFAVKEFHTLEAVTRELSDFAFDVLIIRVPYFHPTHVAMLEKIRRRFSEPALITSAPEIDPSARYQVRKLVNHKLLEEPVETGDLVRLIEKMRAGDPGALRLHPRRRRMGQAEIVDHAGGRHPAKFLDFAQMGARLVVRPRERILRNTHLQLHFASTSDPGKVHRIESVVVWEGFSNGGGMVDSIVNGPHQTLGLRFIAAL
jgi:hypothetical protein